MGLLKKKKSIDNLKRNAGMAKTLCAPLRLCAFVAKFSPQRHYGAKGHKGFSKKLALIKKPVVNRFISRKLSNRSQTTEQYFLNDFSRFCKPEFIFEFINH